jgi:hypothetical protein
MLTSRRISLALGAACICLFALASSALAAGPATVTVRVEGLNATLVPPTQVTTTTAPVVKDGNPGDACPGTSAIGALELATDGNWGGPWSTSFHQYELFSIEGESHEFGSGAFWDLWVDHVASEVGACEAEPSAGQEVLLYPCPETASECPSPLGIQAPDSANLNEPLAVSVVKYAFNGAAAPVSGASIIGGGTQVSTNASGQATVSFSSAGEHTLSVTAPESVRTEATVCVHNANDGTCGTSSSAGTSTGGVAGFKAATPPYKGPFALVASVKDPIDGHVYPRADAPRVLAGTILAHTGVSAVSLELRREYKGRCSAYEGVRERFVRAGCGHGSFFNVSSNGTFSYLLPSALAPGRYVLDIQASDLAGNRTTPARGSSRIVFYVR